MNVNTLLLAFVLLVLPWSADAQTSATQITGLSSTAITVSTDVAITFTGMVNGDQFQFMTSGSDCATASSLVAVTTATFTVNLGAAGTYILCLRANGEADSVEQNGISLTVHAASSATAITGLSPVVAENGATTTITLTGAGTGDLAIFSNDCSAATPNVDVSGGSYSFAPSATGTYSLCYRASGSIDSVTQTTSGVEVQVYDPSSATAISAIGPVQTTAGTATTVTFTGASTGDLGDFGTDCTSVTPSTDIGSGSAAFTLSSAGSYKLCFRANGAYDSVEVTGVTYTVYPGTSATAVSAISPDRVQDGVATSITLTGAGSGDLADFATAGNCASTTPSTDVSSGSATFTLSVAGTYDLCFRSSGSIDSVKQTSVSMLATSATSSATQISGISPTGITINWPTTVTFTGATTGDKASFTSDTDCTGTTPTTDIGSGSATFTLTATATYILCFRASNAADSVAVTGVSATVVTATAANVVTAIDYNTVTVSQDTTISLTGTPAAGDLAVFAATGTCATATPNYDVSGGYIIVNSPSTGQMDLCYRKSGGSDSVAQTGISLTVAAAVATGSDPVTYFGGVSREFSLPPGELTTLLKTPEMTVQGSTFEGSGPWEQWFGQMVLSSPDGKRSLTVDIRKDIIHFNRSRARRDAFEGIEVSMTGVPKDAVRPFTVPSHSWQVPYDFLGAEIVFRKIQRNFHVQFPMIGNARRECLDIAGQTLHFFICSAAATEYQGHMRHLSIHFAHLDLVVHEVKNLDKVEGLLPELWGVRPLSEKSASFLVNASSKTELVAKQLPEGEVAKKIAGFAEGAGWAGGEIPEDLQRSCLLANETVLAI